MEEDRIVDDISVFEYFESVHSFHLYILFGEIGVMNLLKKSMCLFGKERRKFWLDSKKKKKKNAVEKFVGSNYSR